MNKKHDNLTDIEQKLLNSPDVSESVKQAFLSYTELENQQTFKSPDLKDRYIAFLTAMPEDFAEGGAGRTQFASFCEDCRNAKNTHIIECVTDRYTAPAFIKDSNIMSFIGVQLGIAGFDKDAIRCFTRAREILSG